jgi:IclR family KDG regulon transcriptional repressor
MREVPALGRGLRILDLLASSRAPMTVPEIAAALDLPRSAAYELVHTLRVHRAVDIADTGEVVLGGMVFKLGNAFEETVDLARLAARAAEAAGVRVQLPCQVGVLDGAHVRQIAKAEFGPPSLFTTRRRLPAQCTAIGKMLLAGLPPAEFERAMKSIDWGACSRSITDPERLRRELDESARRGWAFDGGEFDPDVSSLAVPVRDDSSATVAAIAASELAGHMTRERCDELRMSLVDAATDFSAALGYRRVTVRAGRS